MKKLNKIEQADGQPYLVKNKEELKELFEKQPVSEKRFEVFLQEVENNKQSVVFIKSDDFSTIAPRSWYEDMKRTTKS